MGRSRGRFGAGREDSSSVGGFRNAGHPVAGTVVNRRGVLAAVLGFVYPGLGHVYLRKWMRALSWFLLAVATAALVVPPSAYEAFNARGVQGLLDASESFGLEVTLSLLAIRLLNVVDAYIVAVRQSAAAAREVAESTGETVPGGDAEAPETCPACGKELDAELDFCPWCTQRLDRPPADSDPADGESPDAESS